MTRVLTPAEQADFARRTEDLNRAARAKLTAINKDMTELSLVQDHVLIDRLTTYKAIREEKLAEARGKPNFFALQAEIEDEFKRNETEARRIRAEGNKQIDASRQPEVDRVYDELEILKLLLKERNKL